LSIFEPRAAGLVMQHTGIRSACHDRRIGRRLCALPAEFVQQLSLEFVFAQTASTCLYQPHMRVGGDLRGAPHRRDLGRVLQQAHLIDDRQQVDQRGRRTDTAAAFRTHRIEPAMHAGIQGGVGTERAVNRWRVFQQRRHHHIERVD
jgi:hypothetical protein